MSTPIDLLRAVAQDLTALHDPDLILTGLVRRVRTALDCDLAYISLNDPDTRATRIRFADGVRTPEYASISMPIGTGVLGLAAAGVTTESPDYLPDLAKLHIEAVDIAVSTEGVRAILGTPLRAGGEVVGALMIANRIPGSFSSDQRALLEEAALIGSAAVELHLLRHDIDRSQHAFEQRLSRLTEQAATATAQLTLSRDLAAALAAGHDSAQLMTIAATAIDGTVELSETSDADIPGTELIPLEGGGAIQVSGSDPQLTAQLAPTIGMLVSIAVLYENAIEDARHFREAELVERLIDPPPSAAGLTPRSGLPGTGGFDVILAEIASPLALRHALSVMRRTLGTHAISASRRDTIIVISRQQAARSIVAEALQPHNHYAGIASATTEADISAAFAEASLLARASRRLNRADKITGWEDLGVVAFAIGGTPDNAHDFVSNQLTAIAGDTDREATLRLTALTYLDNQGSAPTVATRLGIHENTVRQRLNRIDALIPGWRHGPRALDVHIALRARLLIEPTDEQARDR